MIFAILLAGSFAQKELGEYTSTADAIQTLKRGEVGFGAEILTKETEATERLKGFEKAALVVLSERIKAIEDEIGQRLVGRQPIDLKLCVVRGGEVCDRYFKGLKADAELSLLEQERDYLKYLAGIANDKNSLAVGQIELERLRKSHAAAYSALQEKEVVLAQAKSNMGLTGFLNPWSAERQNLRLIERAHMEFLARNKLAYEEWARQKRILDLLNVGKELKKFQFRRDQFANELTKLTDELAELEGTYRENWVAKFNGLAINVLPASFAILVSVMLAPVAIKAFLYFFVARWASRRRPILILPTASGMIQGEATGADSGADLSRNSVVSRSITIDKSHELVIHSEYLQSSAVRGEKETKWVLDWSYPMTSFAAGLVGLTRIRATESDTVVVSSTTDPFSEVAVIALPEGSAIVFQPHNLVGVVQLRDRPVSISRHWQLGNLNSWLTLQLRYLVFHGPVQLIVKGCRGVRIESADDGRSISQAATIGFSANLAYSMTRCETFGSYLMGKQELFNDNFGGGPGFYVYEEMPHFGKKTGITGRGLEGILDSCLKVFGI